MGFILVHSGDDLEGVRLPLLLDFAGPLLDLIKLFLGEDAGFGVGEGEVDATENILIGESSIKVDTFVVLDHQGVKAAF